MKKLLIFILILFNFNSKSFARDIVVTIPPLTSLVSMVTDNIPQYNIITLVKNGSAHNITLTLKQKKIINNAFAIFIVSGNLEKEVYQALKNNKATVIITTPNIKKYPIDFTTFSHEKASASKITDPHIWLDTNNAKAILNNIATVLAQLDPDHKQEFFDNVKKYSGKLDDLTQSINKGINHKNLGKGLYYHNGWQYFVKQFKLPYLGAINIESGDDHNHINTNLSINKLMQLENYIKENNIQCIFIEPQFQDKSIINLAKSLKIKLIKLDPLGEVTKNSQNLYFNLMEENVQQLVKCS